MKSSPELARCFSCASPDHISSQCPQGRLCINCKSPDHLAQDCPLPDMGNDIRNCYACGGVGHIAKNCAVSRQQMKQEGMGDENAKQQQEANAAFRYQESSSGFQHPQQFYQSMQQQQQQHHGLQGGPMGSHVPSVPGIGGHHTKFRSASVNSTSSFDSFYSGFGNQLETEQELNFDSPSGGGAFMVNPNRVTPPTNRDQPSPFQPIGYGTPIGNSSNNNNNNSYQMSSQQQQRQQSGFMSFGSMSDDAYQSSYSEQMQHHRNLFDASPELHQVNTTLGSLYSNSSVPSSSMSQRYAPSGPNTPTPTLGSAQSTPAKLQPTTTAAATSSGLNYNLSTPRNNQNQGRDANDIYNNNDNSNTATTSEKKKRKKKKKKKGVNDEDQENGASKDNQEQVRCYNCDQVGHLSRDCTMPRACFLCGEFTHVAKQCQYSALAKELEMEEIMENPAPIVVEKIPASSPPTLADIVAGNGRPPSSLSSASSADEDGDKSKKNVCLNCNNPGHRLKNCPHGRKCFQCGKVGHVARECPMISEQMKLLQKRRQEENQSPLSSGNQTPVTSSTSTYSFVTSSSPSTGTTMSSSHMTQRSNGPVSPFMVMPMGSASARSVPTPSTQSSISSMSPSVGRPDSCSPPLIFGGGGAFSSFAGMGLSSTPVPMRERPRTTDPIDHHLHQHLQQHHHHHHHQQHHDMNQQNMHEDSQLQDLVTHLLTDLDMSDRGDPYTRDNRGKRSLSESAFLSSQQQYYQQY